MRAILTICLCLLLGACLGGGSSSMPIPTALLPAPVSEGRVLVIVLPGRGDDLDGLRRSGIAESIQAAWPQADVLLAAVTMPYYYGGRMPQQLHEQVVLPARTRGYDGIWLAGASMGGMGALLYERAYPEGMDGLVLLAPFLGDGDLLAEIRDAGLAGWSPGPAADVLDAGNYQREVWRHVRTWLESGRGDDVWLAYGTGDRLAEAMPILAPAVRGANTLPRPGGHAWTVWRPAAKEIFASIRAGRAAD